MPEHTRRPDVIDDAITTNDRVRMLEITQQGNTIVPAFWRPNTEELDAIAQHMLMMGVWNGAAWPVLDPSSGPAAQYLAALLWQQGWPSEDVAQGWTRFMQRVGALPPTTAVGQWAMSTGPSGAPEMTTHWAVPGGASSPAPPEWQRRVDWAGLPPRGTWSHFGAGTGSPACPDLNGTLEVANAPGETIVQPGALRGTFTEDPIMARNNTYGFTEPTDCGGPNTPKYNGSEYPGMPIPYDSGANPCPEGNAIGAVFYGGSITRAALFMSELDVYAVRPPTPLAPGDHPAGGIRFAQFGSFPGLDWLMDTIADELPAHPIPAAWYAGNMPAALGAQNSGTRSNHLALRLGAGWYGRLEMQLHDRYAVLRGTVTTFTDNLRNGAGQHVASWPVGYNESWPAWYGPYLLPETPMTGYPARLTASLADGTIAPCSLQPHIHGVRRIKLDDNWLAFDWEPAHPSGTVEQVDVTFDGAIIPVRWP